MGTSQLLPERLKEASFIGFSRLGSPPSLQTQTYQPYQDNHQTCAFLAPLLQLLHSSSFPSSSTFSSFHPVTCLQPIQILISCPPSFFYLLHKLMIYLFLVSISLRIKTHLFRAIDLLCSIPYWFILGLLKNNKSALISSLSSLLACIRTWFYAHSLFYLLVSCLADSLTLKMDAVHSSDMLVDFYQTTWCCNPEHSTLQNSNHQTFIHKDWLLWDDLYTEQTVQYCQFVLCMVETEFSTKDLEQIFGHKSSITSNFLCNDTTFYDFLSLKHSEVTMVIRHHNVQQIKLSMALFHSWFDTKGDFQLTFGVSFSKVYLGHTTALSQCSFLGHQHCELPYVEELLYPPQPKEYYGWKCYIHYCILNLRQKIRYSLQTEPIKFQNISVLLLMDITIFVTGRPWNNLHLVKD